MIDHPDKELQRYVGSRAAARRRELAFSHDQVAATISVSADNIEKFERGDAVLSTENVADLCSLLRVRPEWLLEGWESPGLGASLIE